MLIYTTKLIHLSVFHGLFEDYLLIIIFMMLIFKLFKYFVFSNQEVFEVYTILYLFTQFTFEDK